MALEVDFGQVMLVGSAIVGGLSTTVGLLAKWFYEQFKELRIELSELKQQHQDCTRGQARLEGRLEEIERINPTKLAETVANAVLEGIKARDNATTN